MDLTALSLITIAATTLVVLILLVVDLKRSKKEIANLETGELKELREKNLQALQEAYLKAQLLVSTAQDKSKQIIAQSKSQTAKFDSDYEALLDQKINQALADFQKHLFGVDSLVGQKLNALFEEFETRLSDLMLKAQDQSIKSIDLELKSARNLIDTYKAQQLQLVDENIVAMLERTLAMVIAKKLTLKDQLDLVNEALEKAKVEKFIV